MTRPVLTLKPPPPPAEPAKPAKKSRNVLSRQAVRFLAELELPLFQRMQKLSVLLPMAVGIRDDIIARVDPALHDKVKKALADIAYSPGYRYALHVDGARRHNLDSSDWPSARSSLNRGHHTLSRARRRVSAQRRPRGRSCHLPFRPTGLEGQEGFLLPASRPSNWSP